MKRKRKGERGAVLVEMLIAGLLLSIAVSAVIGALLGTAQASSKADQREEISLFTNQLLQELKNYVTADYTPVVGAPGVQSGGKGTWRLPGDPCNCWALQVGTHNASSLLPSDWKTKYRAKMIYTVSIVRLNNLDTRRVDVQVDWTEPN